MKNEEFGWRSRGRLPLALGMGEEGGENLLNRLAQSINKKGFSPRRLREYRQFYLVYPVLGVEVEKYIDSTSTRLLDSGASSIWRLTTAKLQASDNQSSEI